MGALGPGPQGPPLNPSLPCPMEDAEDLTIDKNGAVGMDEMNRPSSGGDNGAVGMDEMNKSPERGGGVQMGAWLN